MEIKQIKELMAVMQRTGTKRLSIKKEGVEVELEREDHSLPFRESALDLLDENPMKQEIALHKANMLLSRAGGMVASLPNTVSDQSTDTTGKHITSPMVGTFYRSPSADEPPFVKVGDKVEKDTVVCIIEAMKVMNEVKAGASGIVAEVLVENANPVEFGTKLFKIT